MPDATEQVTLAARLAAMREEDIPSRVMANGETGYLNFRECPTCGNCRHPVECGKWWWTTPRFVYGRNEPCDTRTAELEIDAAQRKALLDKAWRLLLDEDGEVGVYISLDIARMYPSLHAAYTAVFGDAREEAGDAEA